MFVSIEHQLADARMYRTYVTCYADSVLFFQLDGYHCGKNTVATYQQVNYIDLAILLSERFLGSVARSL